MMDSAAIRMNADDPRPPLPPPATTHAERLAELEWYTRFEQADGYLDFHFIDSGGIEVACGANYSIPFALYTPEEREQDHRDDLPQTGWVGEFKVGAPATDCPLDVDVDLHFVALAYTFEEVVERLYTMVRAGRAAEHACESHVVRRAKVLAAMERAEALFRAGELAADEFPTRLDAVRAAVGGHWRFWPQVNRPPTTEELAAVILTEHPDVKRVVDLRPEAHDNG